MRKVLRRIGKICLWILAIVVLVLSLLFIALQLDSVQSYLISKGEDYFNSKTSGTISIEEIDIDFPLELTIKNFKLLDPEDKLVGEFGVLSIDLAPRLLLVNTVSFDKILLKEANASIIANQDGEWNFDFIAQGFTSTDTTAKSESSQTNPPWDFTLAELVIRDVNFYYQDHATGDSLSLSITETRIDFENFSVLDNSYIAKTALIDDTRGFYSMGVSKTEKTTADTSNSSLPKIGLSELKIRGSVFDFEEQVSGSSYNTDIGSLILNINRLNIDSQEFDIESLDLDKVNSRMLIGESATPDTGKTSYFVPISMKLTELSISESSMLLNTIGDSIDHNLELLKLQLSNLFILPNSYDLKLEEILATYNDYPKIDNVSGRLLADNSQLKIEDFLFQSGSSNLAITGITKFSSIETFVSNADYDSFEIDLKTTIAPELYLPLSKKFAPAETQIYLPKDILNSRILASGTTKKFNLKNFDLSIANTSLHAQGNYTGSKPLESGTYNLEDFELDILKSDWEYLLQALELDSVALPSKLSLNSNGRFSETKSNATLSMKSDFGNLEIDIDGDGYAEEVLSLNSIFEIRELYYPISDQSGSEIRANLNGSLSLEDLKDSILTGMGDIHFDSLMYQNYKLSEIDCGFLLYEDSLSYNLSLRDSFLLAQISGLVELGENIRTRLDADIEGIDFQGLGLLHNDIRGQLKVKASYAQDTSSTSGEIKLDELLFIREDNRYTFEPIEANVFISEDSSSTFVSSDFLNLNSIANTNVKSLTEAIKQSLFGSAESLESDAEWIANYQISDLKSIRELFLPEIKNLSPSSGRIEFNASKRILEAEMDIPEMHYDIYKIDSLRLRSGAVGKRIEANLSATQLALGDYSINYLDISGLAGDSLTTFSLTIDNDSNKVADYDIRAEFSGIELSGEKGIKINIQDSLVLNSNYWKMNSANQIEIYPSGSSIKNLDLSNSNDSLSVFKELTALQTKISTNHFDLSSLSSMIYSEYQLIDGLAYGEVLLNQDGTFHGDGRIDGFKVLETDFGKFTWLASKVENKYAIDLASKGNSADFKLKGYLQPISDTESSLDINLVANKLPLSIVPKLQPDVFSDAEGFLKGELEIKGAALKPELSGNFEVLDGKFGLVANGLTYSVDGGNMMINPKQIDLNSLVMSDEQGRNLKINGEIRHENFENIALDLNVNGKEFLLVDTEKGSNDLFYGKLSADLDIDVNGKLLSPSVKAQVDILSSTFLSLIVPNQNNVEGLNEDLLVWKELDNTKPEIEILTREKSSSVDLQNPLANTIDLNGTVRISEQAKLRIIIDTLAGDYLELTGGGVLGVTYDRAGNLRLSGTYQVNDGFYQMTFYNVAKRKFNIEKGSTVVWNGGPTEAALNITALYKTKANLVALMTSEQGSTNPAYQQQLPFEVVMNITGDIEEPQIKFNIRLEESAKGALNGAVDARLNQLAKNESDMNKQVFALLILNTFISTNSEANPNLIANSARNSASQILSQQLNSLSSKVVKGIDLNFDLESYGGGSGAGNTDLNIDVSKSLLNDRMIVRVGSTIALESNIPTGNSQDFMTNVIVEYKLTKDGRYRFKAYSKTDLEDIVVGRITRTGAGFVFQRDFDRFRHLLNSNSGDLKEEEETKPIEEN